ncbi:DUF4145 domain-containing protein [Nocardia sp. NPDC057455]|uniref:DUF4145 domain-containing protein n=1 Tax=Nocardia sp. NPDC057455 TaxID=3346138 RepID=UPI00366F9981
MDWGGDLDRLDVLPAIVRRALAEVDGCMRGGAYAMATVAARRGLEALCRDQGVTKGTLEKRLIALKEAGTIDGRLAEWATHLRNIGNEGAHDLDFEPDREEAADSKALLEGMVRYVYIDQARYEEAKRRWEYRRLPPLDLPYELTTYKTGCAVLTILKSREVSDAHDDGRREIGTWVLHWSGFPSEAKPKPGDLSIGVEGFASGRRAAAIWLEARGYRLGEWKRVLVPAKAIECPDDTHSPPF